MGDSSDDDLDFYVYLPMNPYSSLDLDDETEELPGEFFITKWPSPPTANGNSQVGEDLALAWYMDFRRGQIQENYGFDIVLDVGRKER